MASLEAVCSEAPRETTDRLRPEERAVIAAIRDTRFGAVEIVVHQSRIVQVTRSEKQRFEPG